MNNDKYLFLLKPVIAITKPKNNEINIEKNEIRIVIYKPLTKKAIFVEPLSKKGFII